jgi:hypothetical protein
VVSLLTHKVIACIAVFLILFAGAWQAEQNIQGSKESKILNRLPDGVSILHTEVLPQQAIFSPREYVKIIRYEVEIIDEDPLNEENDTKEPTSFISYE